MSFTIRFASKKDMVSVHQLITELAVFENEPIVPDRNPPIRFRKNIPVSWIKIKLTEGKNRQVRKMTAAVGFPTLRLIRVRIGKINLDNIMAGEVIEVEEFDV